MSARSSRRHLENRRDLGDLLAAVEKLWPGADVSPARIADADWIVLPSARKPRLLVPALREAAHNAVGRHSAALRPSTALVRSLAGRAIGRISRLGVFDGIALSQVSTPGIDSHLADVFNQEVVVALGVGAVRANRKPVLQAFSTEGRPLGFAKIGDTEVAAEHVSGEACNLKRISSYSFQSFRHPQIIDFSHWRGMPVLVISALPTPAWQGLRSRWNVPISVMDELSRSFRVDETAVVDLPFWTTARETLLAIFQSQLAQRAEKALVLMERTVGSRLITAGAWHGDLTPWNMARYRDTVHLWDWERFETGVPHGFDRVHYVSQTYTRERGYDRETLLKGIKKALPAADSPGSDDSVVATSYLMSLTFRYLKSAHRPGGHVLMDRARTTLKAWESTLGVSV